MWKHKNFINLQLCATFKHFFDAGTIGSGTVKFRHYSQTEPSTGETWVWNEYPQFPDDNYVICENVPFTSNQTKFTSIIMKNGESGYEDGLYYNSEYVLYGEVREWVNSAFRTITFDNPVTDTTYVDPDTGATLLEWLQEYAVKQ